MGVAARAVRRRGEVRGRAPPQRARLPSDKIVPEGNAPRWRTADRFLRLGSYPQRLADRKQGEGGRRRERERTLSAHAGKAMAKDGDQPGGWLFQRRIARCPEGGGDH